MIESKILGSAVGIQRQDVIDKTESTVLPSLTNGVFMGRFKRGRMNKPFTVTNNNYRSLLGHDPSNPSYLAVEDAFKRGVSELSVLRIGEIQKELSPPDGSGNGTGVNFLKIREGGTLIEAKVGRKDGIVYQLGDGVLRAAIIEDSVNRYTPSSVLGAASGIYIDSIGGYESFPDNMPFPSSLDKSAAYMFGLNDRLLAEFLAFINESPTSLSAIASEVVITIYPASKLPSANIDYDIFDFFIDPDNYTSSDLQYFAEFGATPAVKNIDGSYSIGSQLKLSFP